MLPYFPFGNHFNDKIGTVFLTENEPLVDVDTHYQAEIGIKRHLLTEHPAYYFQAQPGHETAQWDVLDLVLNDLSRFWPDSFSLHKTGNSWRWENKLLNETATFTFGDAATLPMPPLDWVGRQIQEDLLVLAGDGPSLVAGQLCFGNVWSLDEKLGLPFWEIHAPITPIVEPMMRAAQNVMNRLLIGRPVWRLNWSIKTSDQLDMTTRRMPELKQQLYDQLPFLIPETIDSQVFIRIERQTLTRLPRSQAILFGLHTYQNRLDHELAQRPDAVQKLLNVLTTAPPALLEYKGISPFFAPLIDHLNRRVTNEPSTA
ncbi:MAG: DUF3445 domain-containing protein [Rudanella sp.]|nr:DUF3445 domain-containing protein [Rudanella sp.]